MLKAKELMEFLKLEVESREGSGFGYSFSQMESKLITVTVYFVGGAIINLLSAQNSMSYQKR